MTAPRTRPTWPVILLFVVLGLVVLVGVPVALLSSVPASPSSAKATTTASTMALKEQAPTFSTKEAGERLAALLADLRSDDPARRKAAFHDDRRLVVFLNPEEPSVHAVSRAEVARAVCEQYKHADADVRWAAVRVVRHANFNPKSMDLLLPDLLAGCETFFDDQFGPRQVEAAAIHWRRSKSEASGKVLGRILADRKRDVPSRSTAAEVGVRAASGLEVYGPGVTAYFAPVARPDGYPALLRAVLADTTEPAELRSVACLALTNHAHYTPEFQPDFRDLVKGLLAEATTPDMLVQAACAAGDTRALELAVTQKQSGTKPNVPDSFDGYAREFKPLQKLTAGLVLDRKRTAAVRHTALRSLPFGEEALRKDHPDVLAWLERAFADIDEPLEVRVAAAKSAPITTAEQFASVIRTAADDKSPKAELRHALLTRFKHLLGQDLMSCLEWVSDELLPSLVRVSGDLAGYSSYTDGSKWYSAVIRAKGVKVVRFLRAGLTTAHALDIHLDALDRLAETDLAATRPAVPDVAAVLDLGERYDHGLEQSKMKACGFLRRHGKEAKVALPALARCMGGPVSGDTDERKRYLDTYTALGGEPLPVFLGLLDHTEWGVRQFAIRQIGVLGPDAKSAAPALCAHLRAREKLFAGHAPDDITTALALLGPDVFPEVKKLTEDESVWVRMAGADTLGKMGPECRSVATPVLRKLYRELRDSRVLNALEKVNPDEAARIRNER